MTRPRPVACCWPDLRRCCGPCLFEVSRIGTRSSACMPRGATQPGAGRSTGVAESDSAQRLKERRQISGREKKPSLAASASNQNLTKVLFWGPRIRETMSTIRRFDFLLGDTNGIKMFDELPEFSLRKMRLHVIHDPRNVSERLLENLSVVLQRTIPISGCRFRAMDSVLFVFFDDLQLPTN